MRRVCIAWLKITQAHVFKAVIVVSDGSRDRQWLDEQNLIIWLAG
jgi:hypothetical protein